MNTELINNYLRRYYYRWYKWPRTERNHQTIVREISKRGYANIVFFASSLPMWHLQGVYDLFHQDQRFKTHIILRPFITYSTQQREHDIAQLREYFDQLDIPYTDASQWEGEQCNLMTNFKPDIMFYPQPYWYSYGCGLDSEHYFSRLLCYLPYAINTILGDWVLNDAYLNRAWKLFYEGDHSKSEALRVMHNRGRNVVAVGNYDADIFIGGSFKNVWKQQTKQKKRIIWAPHWSIVPDEMMNRGSFLWLYEFMLHVAKKYNDQVQIAFKPHPRLKSALYAYPDWGQKRADAYYAEWQKLENGQLEEGGYADLFMTSDALIHDCGSFTVQYHYSRHPVLFTSDDNEKAQKHLNQLGQAALDAHYLGNNVENVERFITQNVLGGNDPKKSVRDAFYQEYLLPPHGKTVAQNIYDDIVSSLFG